MSKNKAFSLIEISIVILIIGILISGVVSGSRLVNKSRLASAQTLTQSSPVGEIDNLSLWLESVGKSFVNTNGTANIRNNDKISIWRDINPQIASKKDAVATNPSNSQPVYVVNTINGLPAIYFDATSDNSVGDILEVPAYSSEMGPMQTTIFIVLQIGETTSNISTLLMQGNASSGYNIDKVLTAGGRFQVGINFTTGGLNMLGPTLQEKTPAIFRIKIADNNFSLHYNTQQWAYSGSGTYTYPKYPNSPVWGEIPYFILGAQRFGNNGVVPTKYFDGYVGEVIVYSRILEDDEIADIEKYLAKKWVIKI